MKPTAEEWKKAWEKVESHVNDNTQYSMYFIDLSKLMKDWRPKEEICESDPIDEPPYTLSEIVALAEPGDEFTHPDWGLRTITCLGAVVGVTHPENLTLHIAVTKENLSNREWEFTKRPQRCPHCGKAVEE